MFAITVAFGNMSAQLMFKEETIALESWNALQSWTTDSVAISDDFGRTMCIASEHFAGAIFENLDLSREAAIEIGLHQARTQAAAQKRAQSDPVLNAPNLRGGPAVLSPMGHNGRGF